MHVLLLFVCLLSGYAAVSSAARPPRLRPLSRQRAPVPARDVSAAPTTPAPSVWPWQPISVNIPIPRDAGSSVPLVILPVSMVAPERSQTDCRVSQHEEESDVDEDEYSYEPPQSRPATAPRRPDRRQPATKRPILFEEDYQAPGSRQPQPQPQPQPQAQQYPAYVTPNELDQTIKSPRLTTPFTSEELVKLFREQAPVAPSLPPVLLSEHDRTERMLTDVSVIDAPLDVPAQTPPRPSLRAPTGRAGRQQRPQFSRSFMMMAELTVPRADFTEPYMAWYDATSGASRVDLHGGSTSTFRTFNADGQFRQFEMHVDRAGETAVRRCGRTEARPATADDKRPPGLPDLTQFTFASYEVAGNDTLERWVRQVAGAPGELGAARGERLTVRHELLLARLEADRAVPIQYTVSMDSSVLGTDCDGYQHRYLSVVDMEKEAKFFEPKIDEMCDAVETLNSAEAEQLARLDPLREFTLPHRDLRYDTALQSFKSEHDREYADSREEAVRKNVLVQSSRYSASGNREGATFALGVNYLADRLDAELALLMGAEQNPGDRDKGAQFPHSRQDLSRSETELPDRFDWRPRGAVSPVQFQGASCASCWAFAVSGAVEGALFVRSRHLVPLSTQCLVDCAHPFGGRGCGGTWPSHAYEYVRARGLPAADQYPSYSESVKSCAEERVPPVTRISGHVNVTKHSVTALKVAIKQHAPSVVLVDANHKSFVLYKNGVLYDDRCGKTLKKLKHAVLAVGWGTRKGESHFVLKNSWSAAWGEHGYVRVQAGANTCGVLTQPSYPVLQRNDVLRRELRAVSDSVSL